MCSLNCNLKQGIPNFGSRPIKGRSRKRSGGSPNFLSSVKMYGDALIILWQWGTKIIHLMLVEIGLMKLLQMEGLNTWNSHPIDGLKFSGGWSRSIVALYIILKVWIPLTISIHYALFVIYFAQKKNNNSQSQTLHYYH